MKGGPPRRHLRVRTLSSFSPIGRAQSTAKRPDGVADRGVGLVEILVAVVLMATVVVSVLVALQVTTKASAVDRDQANLVTWLQAASDEIYNGNRVPCTSGQAAVTSAYDALVKQAARPAGWETSGTIRVSKVQFLGRAQSGDPFSWGDGFCFEVCPPYCQTPLYAQKVTIEAVAPGGARKILETVKGE
jgi:type II secretory pathway pseudopilin PulG